VAALPWQLVEKEKEKVRKGRANHGGCDYGRFKGITIASDIVGDSKIVFARGRRLQSKPLKPNCGAREGVEGECTKPPWDPKKFERHRPVGSPSSVSNLEGKGLGHAKRVVVNWQGILRSVPRLR